MYVCVCVDDKGQASLRLRIDDVSKNHQKQSFVIQIAPDTNSHPLNNDISPDECSALEVRSKRNKTKRPREDDAPVSHSSGNLAAQKIAIVNNNSNRVSAITLAANALAAPSASSAKPSAAAASITSSATPTATAATAAANVLASISLPMPQASPDIQTVSRSVLEKTAMENKRLNDLMSNFDKDEEGSGAGAGAAPPASREQVGEAISGLVEWSQAMMDAVASLQWQFIGNEKLANGGVRPLYEMQNPNNTITTLFNRYHDFAVPGLTMLYHNHFSHGGDGGSGSGSGSGGAQEDPVKKESKGNQDVGK